MDQHAGFAPNSTPVGVLIAALGNDHLPHWQFVLAGKDKVPLVVGRYAHDRPRAVVGQHVVGDPDRHQLPAGGVANLGTKGHPPLRFVLSSAFLLALATHQVAEGLHRQLLSDRSQVWHQGVLRSEHQVGGSINGVWPGGEDRNLAAAGSAVPIHHLKLQLCPRAAANPVGLHGAHPLRPAIELGEIVEQLVSVGSDLQKPLAQLALFHQSSGAPRSASAVHLFIGQYGLVDRVPIHGGILLVSQARL